MKPQVARTSAGQKILVIEDDPVARATPARLKLKGFMNVALAADAVQRSPCKPRATRPHLADLVSCAMGFSSWTAAKIDRRRHPLLGITAAAMPENPGAREGDGVAIWRNRCRRRRCWPPSHTLVPRPVTCRILPTVPKTPYPTVVSRDVRNRPDQSQIEVCPRPGDVVADESRTSKPRYSARNPSTVAGGPFAGLCTSCSSSSSRLV